MGHNNAHGNKNRVSSGLLDSCHGFCRRAPSSLCSEDDVPASGFTNEENEQLVLIELRRRSMEAKMRLKNTFFVDDHSCVYPQILLETKSYHTREDEEHEDDGGGGDDDDEFFSIRSYLSRCSSGNGSVSAIEALQGHSVLEEFRHCKGWPFGLCKRSLVPLPPLPNSPSQTRTSKNKTMVANRP